MSGGGPFQPGDVVVRVPLAQDTCGWKHENDDEAGDDTVGKVYRVIRFNPANGPDCASIELEGEDNYPRGWCCGLFRKIDDEVTADFREQLRALKAPAKTGAR